ncbi:MAG: proteasome subunit beta [Nanoarchaeota archaeon]|nr:proteasome subunit beta [Nanoarchaeota archaeon]
MESKKGTTTIGVVYKDGIILVADRRVTAGNLVAHKSFKKLYRITDNIAVSVAGMVSDNQMLIKYLKSAMKKYEIERDREPSVKACSTYLSHLLYGNRFSFPFQARILIGGYGSNGPCLYSLGGDGSRIDDDYISTGSGSPVAYGVLESSYRKNMSVEQARELAMNSLKAAMERDAFTGEGIDLMTITVKGIKYERV